MDFGPRITGTDARVDGSLHGVAPGLIHPAAAGHAGPIFTCRNEPASVRRNPTKQARRIVDVRSVFAYSDHRNCRHEVAHGDNYSHGKEQLHTMRLVSSWRHFLDFECNDCGETTYVDAARDFPATATCRSTKYRTSPEKLVATAIANPSIQIGMPAAYAGCRQP